MSFMIVALLVMLLGKHQCYPPCPSMSLSPPSAPVSIFLRTGVGLDDRHFHVADVLEAFESWFLVICLLFFFLFLREMPPFLVKRVSHGDAPLPFPEFFPFRPVPVSYHPPSLSPSSTVRGRETPLFPKLAPRTTRTSSLDVPSKNSPSSLPFPWLVLLASNSLTPSTYISFLLRSLF